MNDGRVIKAKSDNGSDMSCQVKRKHWQQSHEMQEEISLFWCYQFSW
jgi:hypothetical protein